MQSIGLYSKESENLTRSFIDLWSYAISINKKTFEDECLELINLLDHVRIQWKNSEAERIIYVEKGKKLEELLKASESTNRNLQQQLIKCQSEINSLITKYNANEKELEEYRQKWNQVREKLNDPIYDIEHLKHVNNMSRKSCYNEQVIYDEKREISPIYENNNEEEHFEINSVDYSLSSNSDIDYDNSSNTYSNVGNIRRNTRKRRSTSEHRNIQSKVGRGDAFKCPSKKLKNETTETYLQPTPIRDKYPHGSILITRKRSMSENALDKFGSKYNKIRNTPKKVSASIGSSWTNGESINKKSHRTFNFKSRFEKCDVCNQNMGWNKSDSMRCYDCRIKFHGNCLDLAPIPCLPIVKVPTITKNQKLPLKCYCPSNHPMIPPLIIRCIVAMEKNRLTMEGIYRIPGSETSVIKLYNELLNSRIAPTLTHVDTETITGVIKKFLRELKDTLIPTTSYKDFQSAIETDSDEQLEKAILDLPNSNKDTLAYFLHHLQNVAKYSKENKMPLENLCRVLAPTIVGYSSFITATKANQEVIVRNQFSILYRLLKKPQEFWKQFIDNNTSSTFYEDRRF